MAIGTTATATGTGRTATGPTAMELPVELLAAISAEESSGSEMPSTEPGRFGHANVSGSVRLVVTETDTTGRALHIVATPTHSAEAATLRNERCQTFKGTVKSSRE